MKTTKGQSVIISGKEFSAPLIESLQLILDTREDVTNAATQQFFLPQMNADLRR
jgi:hypothetical protein